MNPAFIIARKRDGHSLKPEEIAFLVQGFSRGEIPDYQMAAFAMATYLRGMNLAETKALTREMLASGDVLSWPAAERPRVDKHSTGGVGDKVSLLLAPLLACCDLCVPMISGRGLATTGGTLDKLESIRGFRTDLSIDDIRRIAQRTGCVITGATANLAPADRKLYALRDVTATVSSIPLIVASILSKKLAEGLKALVLDVKFGSGALMKTRDQACELATSLVQTGNALGVMTVALLTNMDQPLGCTVGNSLEVDEALACLAGEGPDDVWALTRELGTELLVAVGRARSRDEASDVLLSHVRSGRAMARFRAVVAAQGGDLDAARPAAPERHDVVAPRSAWVSGMQSELLGMALIELGGGRRQVTDTIDHAVGFEVPVRIGQRVAAGQTLVRIHARDKRIEHVIPLVEQAILLGEQPVEPPVLIAQRIAA